jgi:hypothetical protein
MTEVERHPQATLTSATREEAAAIVAAIERFMRATAPNPSADAPNLTEGWHAATLLEGVARDPLPSADAWLDTRCL